MICGCTISLLNDIGAAMPLLPPGEYLFSSPFKNIEQTNLKEKVSTVGM